MEQADELIGSNDFLEMEIAVKQGTQIVNKITDLISQLEGMKLDFGVSARDVRQWKKDKKNEFSPFIQENDKISQILSARQRQRDEETEQQNWKAKREREESDTRTTTTRERILGEEVQSRVTRSGAKVGDGNGRESYSRKASQVKDHTLQGHLFRLGPI